MRRWSIVGVALIVGCAADGGDLLNVSDPASAPCRAGTSIACDCPGGGKGEAVCKHDGSGLGACEGCPSSSSSSDRAGASGGGGFSGTGGDYGSGGAAQGTGGGGGTGGTGGAGQELPGVPEVIVSGLSQPRGIVADSTGLYWIDEATGGIFHSSLDGASIMPFAGSASNVKKLVPCGKDIAFTAGSESVYRISKSGLGLPKPVGGYSDGLTCHNGKLYSKYTKTIYPGYIETYIADESSTRIETVVGGISTIAVDDTGIYWGGYLKIMRCDLTGGTQYKVAPNPERDANPIVLDPTDMYFAGNGINTAYGLYRLPKVGGVAAKIGDGGVYPLVALSVNHIYWFGRPLGSQTGDMKMVGKDGTGARTLLSNKDISGLAIHNGYIYWTSEVDKSIGRMSVP